MKVGLPGVGIGGVFYILLVAWMPVREVWLTLQGRSSLRRWRLVGLQSALAVTIVLALAGEWWALAKLPDLLGQMFTSVGLGELLPDLEAAAASERRLRLEHLAPTLVAAPFIIIAGLVAALRIARLIVAGRPGGGRIITPLPAEEDQPA